MTISNLFGGYKGRLLSMEDKIAMLLLMRYSNCLPTIIDCFILDFKGRFTSAMCRGLRIQHLSTCYFPK